MRTLQFLSSFQHGTRNAKTYLTTNKTFGVICFDAQDDFNEFRSFQLEDDAESFAENWVLGHESV